MEWKAIRQLHDQASHPPNDSLLTAPLQVITSSTHKALECADLSALGLTFAPVGARCL
jgi:hypothetical protein